MKLLAALLDKERVLVGSVITHSDFISLISDFIANDFFLILREQVRNLTTIQQIVDVFQEVLTHDLCVREQELNWVLIQTTLSQELFDRLLDIFLLVVLGDLN